MAALPSDKRKHMLVGAAVAAVVGPLFHPVAAMALVTWMAWEKEVYDREQPLTHTYDGWDAFATVAGGVLMLVGIEVWAWLGRWF